MESKTDNEADIFSPFFMGGLLSMQEYSERSMFNFVLGIKCPWERLLPVFQNRQCFWHTHNFTSNDKHVSLAAVSFASDDYADDYVIDPFFVTAAPLLIF